MSFHVFWENLNTLEAHRSGLGIQKWSLEGELVKSFKNLEKYMVSYKIAEYLSTFMGFGNPEPGPVLAKFSSSNPILA